MLNTTKLFIFAAVIMLGGVVAANAQVGPQSQIKTNVPFSFVVDGKTYPAGAYTFGRLDTAGRDDGSQLIMRGPKGVSVIIATIPTISNEGAKDTQLVFEKVAGQNFLTQIWAKGDTEGSELITSQAEKTAIAAQASGLPNDATSGVDGN
jgi:hypothetical protein